MRRVFIVLMAGLLGTFGTKAIASEFANGIYAGFNAGVADNLSICDAIGSPSSPSKCEDTDIGLQLFAGWQIFKWISIEGGWTDLDSSSYTDVTGTTTKSETSGFQLNAVATIPVLERAGVYFKAGALAWDIDVKQTTILNGASSSTESGTDFVYGVAFRYPLTETIGVSLELQRFEDVGNSKTADEYDINLWSAGLLFRF